MARNRMRLVRETKAPIQNSFEPHRELAFERLERRDVPAVVTVTTLTDIMDWSVGTTISDLISNPGADGKISLREAITAADNTSAADTINFNLPSGSYEIDLLSSLPSICNPVTIDGQSQSGFSGKPIIELNGTSAGAANGLELLGSGITIQGLVIRGFEKSGILLRAYPKTFAER